MASDIRDDEVEAILEMSRWRVECLSTGGVSVNTDYRRRASITPVKTVQAQTVDRQECAVRLRVSRHRSSLSQYLLWMASRSLGCLSSGKHTESQEHVQILLSTRQRCCRACVAPT